jgi:hypothetical protein
LPKRSWRKRCSSPQGFCVGEAFSKRSSGISPKETSEPGASSRREAHLSVRRAVMVLQERYRASQRHQVWAMNFQFDATADGRRIKFLSVIDEHSRFCLAATPRPYAAGAMPAALPTRLTSSRDPHGRTALLNGMSSARLRLQAVFAPPGAYAPGSISTGSCRMTITTHSHKAWTDKGGHVTSLELAF